MTPRKSSLPVEPLARRLERAMAVYDGPKGMAVAFAQLWEHEGITKDSAQRQLFRILQRRRPYVAHQTADRWAMFLGSHIDHIWPDGGEVMVDRWRCPTCGMTVEVRGGSMLRCGGCHRDLVPDTAGYGGDVDAPVYRLEGR